MTIISTVTKNYFNLKVISIARDTQMSACMYNQYSKNQVILSLVIQYILRIELFKYGLILESPEKFKKYR